MDAMSSSVCVRSRAHDRAERQFRHAHDARLNTFSKIMFCIMVRGSQKIEHDFSESMKLVLYFFELYEISINFQY
jgi:hypothetical protein